ncbi:MAG TPA: hypothetical protein VGK87_07800 [Anaerolineae bacterium]|jgi:hypothetical protein
MSRPGQPPLHTDPAAPLAQFVQLYRADVSPQALAAFNARAAALGLSFSADESIVLAALSTPARVQQFLNTQLYYNNDHATPDTEETVMSPRQVLRSGLAHCFEGAMFAYALDYLNGYEPRLVLLEASQDSEHNVVVYRDAQTGLYGCNAHSRYPHLDGRPALYTTVHKLALSYQPYYYSDRSNDPNDLTLVGYSDPFDLVAKYGTGWMGSDAQLWDIYYTYLDDTITLHNLNDDAPNAHLYPLLRALRDHWIEVDSNGQPTVSIQNLPVEAETLWHAFWRAHQPPDSRPHGEAKEIERQFFRVTNTTPMDLVDNASDFVYFLEKGYRIDRILTRPT